MRLPLEDYCWPCQTEHVDRLLKRLEENKTPAAAVVGRIQEGEPGKIVVLSRKIAVSSRG